MRLTRYSISILTTGTTDNVDYSDAINGGLYGVVLAAGAGFPSTALLTLTGETNGQTLFALAPTTSGWYKYPRIPACDSTGVNLANGTTGSGIYPVLGPVVNERVKCDLTGCTSTLATGTVYLLVEGA